MKNGDKPMYPIEPNWVELGLTKREYFAAMAMQGILSSCFAQFNPQPDLLAQDALNYADALLSELEKTDQ